MAKLRQEQRVEPELRLNQRQVWDVASVVLACSLIMAALASGQSCVSGFLPGFEWRKPLIIDTTLSGAQGYLTAFSLQVHLHDPALRHQSFGGEVANIKGYDIAFSRMDGATPLSFAIQSYDPVRGELKATLQLDTLYLGKPTACFVYFSNQHSAGSGGAITYHAHATTHTSRRSPLYLDHEAKLRNKVAHSFAAARDYIALGPSQRLEASLQVQYEGLRSCYQPPRRANLITWNTRYEHQCEAYHLERSHDSHAFKVIAYIKGHGFSLDEVPYAILDPNPPQSTCFYRIRHVNYDGTYSYSPVFPSRQPHTAFPLAATYEPVTYR